MASSDQPQAGSILWHDLTVDNAEEVSRFYENVVGWTREEHPMEEYSDYNMNRPDGGETVAGVCHARGPNANIPPQWMMYVAVDDINRSIAACHEAGGDVIDGPRTMGDQSFAIVRDPAGAVLALIGPNRISEVS
jgi:predicted enzyme related to lactoylglutathione lyase